jgi:hypothetical protein
VLVLVVVEGLKREAIPYAKYRESETT